MKIHHEPVDTKKIASFLVEKYGIANCRSLLENLQFELCMESIFREDDEKLNPASTDSGDTLLVRLFEGSERIAWIIEDHLKAQTVKELCRFTKEELLRLPGIGKATLWTIESQLKELSFKLSEHPRANPNSKRDRNFKIVLHILDHASIAETSRAFGVLAPSIRGIWSIFWVDYAIYNKELTQRYGYWCDKEEKVLFAKAESRFGQSGKKLTESERESMKEFAREYFLQ